MSSIQIRKRNANKIFIFVQQLIFQLIVSKLNQGQGPILMELLKAKLSDIFK